MTLNCLTCHSLPRADSQNELEEKYDHEKPNFRPCRANVGRSWSGNLAPRPHEKMRNGSAMGPEKRVMKAHRRIFSSGPVELESSTPRLVRSCGMRRDWSFENLRQLRDEKVK